ncbi:MAG: hypothetical protein GY757_43210, partial [bacterium]|nr:hypothetical protein [bacterium]
TAISGAAAGILYRVGRFSQEELLRMFKGILTGAQSGNKSKTGVIYGLMQTCRELTWQHGWFLQAVDELLQDWEESDFMQSLPELRLAFAGLTPGETDRVAAAAAGIHGEKDLGDLVMSDVGEAEIQAHLTLGQVVAESLTKDGLSLWLSK